MANNIIAGLTTLLATTAGTTSKTGSWFKVDPSVTQRDLAFQAILTASSVGATAGSTVNIEVSNDGVYPLSTGAALIMALTNTSTTYISAGGCLPTSFAGAWGYIRANLSSLTTSTAGSAGSPSVTVTVGAMARP